MLRGLPAVALQDWYVWIQPLLSVSFQQKHVPQLRCTFTVFTTTFSRENKTASRSSQILAGCEAAPRCCLSQIGIVLFCKPPFSAKGQPLKSKLWLLHCSPTPSWLSKHIFFYSTVNCMCFLWTYYQKAKKRTKEKKLLPRLLFPQRRVPFVTKEFVWSLTWNFPWDGLILYRQSGSR